MDALLAGDRLRDLIKRLGRNPTVDEVNHWAVHDPMGHDAINRWICVEARAKELGVYGLCPSCGGKGEVFDSPEQEREYNSWTPREPPIGLGFQMWETTTEGSPQSPVFTTLMELAKWCAKNASVFANETASAEEWAEMLAKDNVHFREGNLTFV